MVKKVAIFLVGEAGTLLDGILAAESYAQTHPLDAQTAAQAQRLPVT